MMFDFITTFPPKPMAASPDLRDHYFFYMRDRTRVFSSRIGDWIPIADAQYQAWLAKADKRTTTVERLTDLMEMLWQEPAVAERCKVALGNPPCRRWVDTNEFLAALSKEDGEAIHAAALTNAEVWMLWSRLLARGQRVQFETRAEQRGWFLLQEVLGVERFREITQSLGMIVGGT